MYSNKLCAYRNNQTSTSDLNIVVAGDVVVISLALKLGSFIFIYYVCDSIVIKHFPQNFGN